jgi:hypothetical protein
MGFTEVLTIVFIVLKLMGIIDWNWFLVLLPEIIALVIYAVIVVITVLVGAKSAKSFKKKMNERK